MCRKWQDPQNHKEIEKQLGSTHLRAAKGSPLIFALKIKWEGPICFIVIIQHRMELEEDIQKKKEETNNSPLITVLVVV